MKASRFFAISFAIITVAFVASAPASAQDRTRNREVPGDRIAGFRGDFNELLDRYEAIFERLGNTRGLRLSAEARESLRVVSDEQLARVFARVRIPDLSAALAAVEILESRTPVRNGPANVTPGFPNAPPILAQCDDISHTPGFTFGALVAFQVVRTVLAAAEFVCQEVIVILGEGGNTSLVCVPFAVAQDVAAIPYELADFCGGEEDSALLEGSYDRLEHIHGDLETARADILTSIDTHTTQIINNDNTNRDLIIANDNANREILKEELRNLTCDLMRLAHTPNGQRASSNLSCAGRPAFPYNWPEHP